MRIESFDPRDDIASLRACFAMTQAAWEIDQPNAPPWPFRSFAGKWSDGFDPTPQQAWLGCDDSGEPVGGYLLQLPDKENLDRATCTMIVAMARRRSGVGTALLSHCATRARQAGRSLLASFVRDGSPGAAFAAGAGASPGIAEVNRVLSIDVGTPDWGLQMITVVLPDHRGRRLGLLVKVAMLELITHHAPEVRRVFTGNAGSNQHMIGINEQLGFKVADTYRSWQLDLAALASD